MLAWLAFVSVYYRVGGLVLLLPGQPQCDFAAQSLSDEEAGQDLAASIRGRFQGPQGEGHTPSLCHGHCLLCGPLSKVLSLI